MSSPLTPISAQLFDTHNPKRLLMIGISSGQQYYISQLLDYPGLLIDFARNSHHAQIFIEELGGSSYDLLWYDEDTMHNGDWEFLKVFTAQNQGEFAPVILQTQPDTNIFKQALAHGIYYFVTKPFTQENLVSVITSALNGLSNFNSINRFVADYKQSITLFRHAIFHARTHAEARSLAATLSYLSQKQEKTSLGLLELMNNAIEHGNLDFGFESKAELIDSGQFESEISKRQKEDEYRDKYVEISVTFIEQYLEFSIRDFGNGFEFDSYLNPKDFHQSRPNGRGILIAKNYSFENLHYEDGGRLAIARVLRKV